MSAGSAPEPGPARSRGRAPPRPPSVDDLDGAGARTYYDGVIRLPGFGEQPDRCRQRKPVAFCSAEGHVTLASASPCETRRCPEHWAMWQQEAAVKIVARLAAWRYVQDGAERRMLHVVDSPDPERRWSAAAFWDERSESYSVVEEVGGRGGVTVPHPYRTSDEGDRLFRLAVEEGEWEEEWGRWSFLRSFADDWEEMEGYVDGGPHYHHLTSAQDFDPEAIPEGRTVKNIRSLERFKLRDMTGYRDMARTVMYLLSHAAWQPPGADDPGGRQTVTYWGDVHPNGFDPEDELTATEWGVIRRNAERAVTTAPTDDLAAEGHVEEDRAECPRDGCDGRLVPLDELRDWLTRDEWPREIDREQRWILKGVVFWLEFGGDRPPPSTEPGRVREWLRDTGREREETQQAGIGMFG